MSDIQFGGSGYDWDIELVGGPFDGFEDIVIQLEGENPPPYIKYLPNKNLVKSKIGEKFFETLKNYEDGTKVIIYKFRNPPGEEEVDFCYYDFVEVTTHGEFVKKYLKMES